MTWSSRQQLRSPVRWRNETRVAMNVSTIETKPQESIEVQPQQSITPRLETSPVHVKGILAATDFSEQATLALKFAARQISAPTSPVPRSLSPREFPLHG